MAKPAVAVDIDDVLFPFMLHLARHHNELYGTNLVLDDFTHPTRFTDVWGGTVAEAKDKLRHFHESGDSSKGRPLEETKEALSMLRKTHSLHVLTSRQSKYEELTRFWLQQHFSGVFDSVNFANYWEENKPFVTKAKICVKLGAVALIDDNPAYIEECVAYGIRGILFGEFPWNRDVVLPGVAVRACNWFEVVRILES